MTTDVPLPPVDPPPGCKQPRAERAAALVLYERDLAILGTAMLHTADDGTIRHVELNSPEAKDAFKAARKLQP